MSNIEYVVTVGWIKGSTYRDSPDEIVCNTLEEAQAAYDAIDLKQIWRTEKMCAGRTFDNRDAFKSIETWDPYESEFIDLLQADSYGVAQENQEQ